MPYLHSQLCRLATILARKFIFEKISTGKLIADMIADRCDIVMLRGRLFNFEDKFFDKSFPFGHKHLGRHRLQHSSARTKYWCEDVLYSRA